VTPPTCPPAPRILFRIFTLALTLAFGALATADWISLYHTGLSQTALVQEPHRRREILEWALRFNPALGKAWLRLGQLELAHGDRDAALRALSRVAQTHSLYEAHHELATVMYTHSIAIEDPVIRYEVLEAFDDALAIYPGDNELINQAARVALWNRDPERARRFLDLADRIDIRPRDPRAQNLDRLLLRGELAHIDGDIDLERRLLRQILLLDPDSEDALSLLADLVQDGSGSLLLAEAFSPWADEPLIGIPHLTRMMNKYAATGDIERLANLLDAMARHRPPEQIRIPLYDLFLRQQMATLLRMARDDTDPQRGTEVIEVYSRHHSLIGPIRGSELAVFQSIAVARADAALREESGEETIRLLRWVEEVRRDIPYSQPLGRALLGAVLAKLRLGCDQRRLHERSELILDTLLDQHLDAPPDDDMLWRQIMIFARKHVDTALTDRRPDVAVQAVVRVRNHRRRLSRTESEFEGLYAQLIATVARSLIAHHDAQAAQSLLHAVAGDEPAESDPSLSRLLQSLAEMN
jgi:tetratricopeptide (TPR) repeat protein